MIISPKDVPKISPKRKRQKVSEDKVFSSEIEAPSTKGHRTAVKQVLKEEDDAVEKAVAEAVEPGIVDKKQVFFIPSKCGLIDVDSIIKPTRLVSRQ